MPKHLISELGIVTAAVLLGAIFLGASTSSAIAQQADTPTATNAQLVPFVTVNYTEDINVRSGPSSIDYPVIGKFLIGASARAIGRSAAGEWILIVAPEGADWSGTGWVYAALVSVTPGFLPVVEPPPTPSPLVTSTLNPTFVAAFQNIPTATRLPTFTPPLPLSVPTFHNPSDTFVGGVPIGMVILLLGILGAVGLVVSSIRRE
jgi:hypothetical protein